MSGFLEEVGKAKTFSKIAAIINEFMEEYRAKVTQNTGADEMVPYISDKLIEQGIIEFFQNNRHADKLLLKMRIYLEGTEVAYRTFENNDQATQKKLEENYVLAFYFYSQLEWVKSVCEVCPDVYSYLNARKEIEDLQQIISTKKVGDEEISKENLQEISEKLATKKSQSEPTEQLIKQQSETNTKLFEAKYKDIKDPLSNKLTEIKWTLETRKQQSETNTKRFEAKYKDIKDPLSNKLTEIKWTLETRKQQLSKDDDHNQKQVKMMHIDHAIQHVSALQKMDDLVNAQIQLDKIENNYTDVLKNMSDKLAEVETVIQNKLDKLGDSEEKKLLEQTKQRLSALRQKADEKYICGCSKNGNVSPDEMRDFYYNFNQEAIKVTQHIRSYNKPRSVFAKMREWVSDTFKQFTGKKEELSVKRTLHHTILDVTTFFKDQRDCFDNMDKNQIAQQKKAKKLIAPKQDGASKVLKR